MCNTLFSLYLLVVQTTSYMWLNFLWYKYTMRYQHCMLPCLPHRSHKWRVNCGFLSWNTSPVMLHGWSQNEVTVALRSILLERLLFDFCERCSDAADVERKRTGTQKESRCERNITESLIHTWLDHLTWVCCMKINFICKVSFWQTFFF